MISIVNHLDSLLFVRIFNSKAFLVVLLSNIGICFLWLHGTNLFNTVTLWFTRPHSYAQGALIFFISSYMVFKQRKQISQFPIQPALITGISLLLFSGFIYLIGNLTLTVTLEQVAIIFTLLGLILLLLGKYFFFALLIPVTYLIFVFPFFQVIVRPQVILLQNISATVASTILRLAGFQVFQSGHLIEMPHIALDVVAACSGLNHIVSLVAIAIPLSVFYKLPNIGKAALIFFAISIGIIANGLRVALIGIWTFFSNHSNVHGPGDSLLVSFVFLFGLSFLFVFCVFFQRYFKYKNRTLGIIDPNRNRSKSIPLSQFRIALLIGIAILSSLKFFEMFYVVPDLFASQNHNVLPATIGKWKESSVTLPIDIFPSLKSDYTITKHYSSKNGEKAIVHFLYFSNQDRDHEFFSQPIRNIINSPKQDFLKIDLQNEEMQTPLHIIPTKFGSASVALFFSINNGIFTDKWSAKVAALKNTIIHRNNNGAIFIFIFPKELSARNGLHHDSLSQFASSIIHHYLSHFS